MATSPSNTHAVSAIRERLSEVSGELVAVEKRWRTLREAHAALSQTLRMFDPEADSRPVKPKRPYRRIWPRDLGKMSRLILDALRTSGQPVTAAEVVTALGDRANGIPDMGRRVQMTLNRLARAGGLVAKNGKRNAAKWELLSPSAER